MSSESISHIQEVIDALSSAEEDGCAVLTPEALKWIIEISSELEIYRQVIQKTGLDINQITNYAHSSSRVNTISTNLKIRDRVKAYPKLVAGWTGPALINEVQKVIINGRIDCADNDSVWLDVNRPEVQDLLTRKLAFDPLIALMKGPRIEIKTTKTWLVDSQIIPSLRQAADLKEALVLWAEYRWG